MKKSPNFIFFSGKKKSMTWQSLDHVGFLQNCVPTAIFAISGCGNSQAPIALKSLLMKAPFRPIFEIVPKIIGYCQASN